MNERNGGCADKLDNCGWKKLVAANNANNAREQQRQKQLDKNIAHIDFTQIGNAKIDNAQIGNAQISIKEGKDPDFQ